MMDHLSHADCFGSHSFTARIKLSETFHFFSLKICLNHPSVSSLSSTHLCSMCVCERVCVSACVMCKCVCDVCADPLTKVSSVQTTKPKEAGTTWKRKIEERSNNISFVHYFGTYAVRWKAVFCRVCMGVGVCVRVRVHDGNRRECVRLHDETRKACVCMCFFVYVCWERERKRERAWVFSLPVFFCVTVLFSFRRSLVSKRILSFSCLCSDWLVVSSFRKCSSHSLSLSRSNAHTLTHMLSFFPPYALAPMRLALSAPYAAEGRAGLCVRVGVPPRCPTESARSRTEDKKETW